MPPYSPHVVPFFHSPFLLLLPYAGPIPPELLFNESRVSAAPRHATLLWPLWFCERKKDGWNKREGSHLDKSRRVARFDERASERSIDRSIDRNHRAS